MADLFQAYQEERDYHNSPKISRSDCLWFMVSPAHFKAAKEEGVTQTPAMTFGIAYHYAILEPHLFEQFVDALTEDKKAEPEKGWTSKKNQEVKERLSNEIPVLLTVQELDMIKRMRDKIYEKQYLVDYLQAKGTEFEVKRSGEVNDCEVRCKIDINHPAYNLDLKTARSASFSAAKREIINSKYYFQAGFYTDVDSGCETDLNDPKPFGFIFQEKTSPYEVSLVWLNNELIAKGVTEYRDIVSQIKECYKYDIWPGYEYWSLEPDSSFTAELPYYLR